MAMVKQVPAEEFITNNRTVAATKAAGGETVCLPSVLWEQETDLALQSASGMFLAFLHGGNPGTEEEFPRFARHEAGAGDELEELYFVTQQPQIVLQRKSAFKPLKVAKRDGKGKQGTPVRRKSVCRDQLCLYQRKCPHHTHKCIFLTNDS